MRITRTIVALLVAVSLAMVPLSSLAMVPFSGGSAMTDPAADASQSVIESVDSTHDCCDQDGIPAKRMIKDCQASAGCFSKCFNFYGVILSSVSDQPYLGRAESPFVGKTFRSHIGLPPLRPPRA